MQARTVLRFVLPLVAATAGGACNCQRHDPARRPAPAEPPAPPASLAVPLPSDPPDDVAALEQAMARLVPLHARPGRPAPGEWRAEHDEPGQRFDEYRREQPVRPERAGKRRIIYIQPLGDLTKTQRRIVDLTGDYMRRFFGLEVRLRSALPLSLVPEQARREHPSWGTSQILTTYVLERVLRPRLPDDAAAYLSLTASDLWPGTGWNFVFGQASLRDRVGVWSIYRNGDPDVDAASFRQTLIRTLKVAMHETGHMFSMRHCTAYRCVMAGSNGLEESDRHPLWLCPECLAKLAWATGSDPVERYRELLEFARQNGLDTEARFFHASLDALEQP